MKFSIITVCYNAEETIEKTIKSVLSQTFKDFEYIVVDGGSKDNTVQILEQYKSKIKYISEKDKGIYDAMNKGIRIAAGEIIGMIGADDFYPNTEVLGTVAKAFAENNTDSAYGDKRYVDRLDTSKVVRYWKQKPYRRENWLNGWMPPHLSFYLKKEAYETYGLYNPEFRCSGDYELMLRMLYKHRLSAQYIPSVLMTMRAGGTSNASFNHRKVANLEDRRAWKINNLHPKWYTLWMKPLSKVGQLFSRK